MSVYVIGDLHLSFGTNKPMNIFGENWENHAEKIKNNWNKKVKETDTIILLGDFSWAMSIKDTIEDFKYLSKLKGKKILLKGNHDYWWTTVTNMKKFLKNNDFDNIDFLFNNSFIIEDKAYVGTRGWSITDTDNEKMHNREKIRLEISLKSAKEKYPNKDIIACMHYPPLTEQKTETEYTRIMEEYRVKKCYYGHLHGISHKEAVEGKINNIEYKLVSSDYLKFDLLKVE